MPHAYPPSAPSFVPPESFEEYRLLKLLGAGAMGSVWLARDTLLDRLVAIKFLAALAPEASARERFLVEARAVARLTHPNVVGIHRVGMLDVRPYLVSEYIRGESLDRVPKPLAPARLASVALGIARGLAAVHRQGIVHRDVKPANAILAADGEVKIVDFGLAKLLDAPIPSMGPASSHGPPVLTIPSTFPPASDATIATDDTIDARFAAGGSTDPAATVSLVRPPSSAPSSAAVTVGDASPPGALTMAGTILGTPRFMAPEVWDGETATPRSDVYSAGALLYALACGVAPHERASTLDELAEMARKKDVRSIAERAPGIDPRLAAVIDRCLRRDPSERFASAEEVRRTLEAALARHSAQPLPEGNPYRGLYAFDEAHASVFFGRSSEVRDVVELLRTSPLVIVAGSSGAGKSSLCRAGVLPAISGGALGGRRTWTASTTTPGRAPLEALARVLARASGEDDARLAELLRVSPRDVARTLARGLGDERGLVVLVDQAEECVTVSPAEDAAAFGDAVRALGDSMDGLRIVTVAREDFLGRLVARTGLGGDVSRALYVLGPLRAFDLRDAIEAPARAMGYRFESAEMVEGLATWVERSDGGLPLLQFALAELWDARDQETRTLSSAALDRMGGVAGALARHADAVIGRLLPVEREAARRLLGSLVTADGTRGQKTVRELGAETGAPASALDALVRGRLVVARASSSGDDDSVHEIAHEALLRAWGTLRGWLASDAEARALRERLSRAAAEWRRLGGRREALWTARQLDEARVLDPRSLPDQEVTFLTRSRRAARARTATTVAMIAAGPLLVALAYGGVRAAAQRDLDARVGHHLTEARAALDDAHAKSAAFRERRARAFHHFDVRERAPGEAAWDDALARAAEADDAFTRALRSLDATLLLDAHRATARDLLAQTLIDAALLADQGHKEERRDALRQRLAELDVPPERTRALDGPAALTLTTRPAGARARLVRFDDRDRHPEEAARDLGTVPVRIALKAGSYLVTLESAGHADVSYPLLLEPDERRSLEVELPDARGVPPGFAYVPSGRFLFGSSGDDEIRRSFFDTTPLRSVESEAYLIARNETTYAEWIDYLSALPAEERARRTPRNAVAMSMDGAQVLREVAPGVYAVTLQPTDRKYTARAGEPIVFPGRTTRASQDWRRFPVGAVSYTDAEAYARWLHTSGRVRGARLCTEAEWERAARGADDRLWPHGNRLAPDDANHDATYGREPLGFGPDEVGSHPASRSPFGVDDLAGNVWEWVASSLSEKDSIVRGGSYYFGTRSSQAMNRNLSEREMRDATVGVRVCATWPPPT